MRLSRTHGIYAVTDKELNVKLFGSLAEAFEFLMNY